MDVRGPLRPSKKTVAIEVVQSKAGRPIPVVNGKLLHSRYDPESEAARWVSEKLAKKPTARIVLVLGLGFGYHIRALRDLMPPGSQIVVFEPVSEIVSAYAGVVGKDIDGVRLWPSPSPQDVVDAVAEVLSPTQINQVLILGHPASVELDPAAYQPILSSIDSAIDQIAMSLTTGWGFGFEWLENALRNVRHVPSLPFLSHVTPMIQAAPPAALVIGAGPSLDAAWEPIRRARVLKLAVDTALEPMESHGEIPHLGFLFDSQAINAQLVDHVDAESINLVVSLEVHPNVFRRRWKNLFLSHCDEGLLSWLERRGKFQAGRLKQGGSVVTSAFDLARQCRSSTIYFTGVDLSFTRRQVYCRGTAYERKALDRQEWSKPIEQTMYEMKVDRSERTVQGRSTQDNLYNYYRWLKDEIGRTPAPVRLLSKEGLLSEFVPSDGASRIVEEKFPTGFDERVFQEKAPPNGAVTSEWIGDALSGLRRGLEAFLAPEHFVDPEKLERALTESGLSDLIETVVQPAIAVTRFEREKGQGSSHLLEELRSRLAGLLRLI